MQVILSYALLSLLLSKVIWSQESKKGLVLVLDVQYVCWEFKLDKGLVSFTRVLGINRALIDIVFSENDLNMGLYPWLGGLHSPWFVYPKTSLIGSCIAHKLIWVMYHISCEPYVFICSRNFLHSCHDCLLCRLQITSTLRVGFFNFCRN